MAKTTKTTKKADVTTTDVATVDMSKISDIAKSLREFRFGAAGARAKNTALPKSMRKARAKILTSESLAIKAKKA